MHLLAAALHRTFPHADLIGGRRFGPEFTYDFAMPQTLPPGMWPQIEEAYRGIAKGETPVIQEMMRENGAALIRHMGLPTLADQALLELDSILKIIKIGNYAAVLKGALDWDPFCKVYGAEAGEEGIRIRGATFPDLQSQKNYLKNREKVKCLDHRLRDDLFRYVEESWLWSPEGMKWKLGVIAFWERAFQKAGFLTVEGKDAARVFGLPRVIRMVFSEGEEERGEGLYLPPNQTFLQGEILTTPHLLGDDVKSSLQFILKNSTVLDVNSRWILQKSREKKSPSVQPLEAAFHAESLVASADESPGEYPQAEGLVNDPLGRLWPFASLSLTGTAVQPKVLITIGPIERIVALLVELNAGQLPARLVETRTV